MTSLWDAGETLKPKKCSSFSEKIDYLGHIIRTGRLENANNTTEAIQQQKDPTNLSELGLFGPCDVFCRLVPNYSRILATLNQKPKNEQAKTFDGLGVDKKQAAESLKTLSTHPLILALSRASGHYTVDVYE